MPTYEELKSQRTGIEKICNLLRTHNGLICLILGILCISIMFLYIPFGAMGTIQKIVVLITCLLFVINVYLFALSRKKKELPHIAHFPKIALTLTCIFALVVAVFKENGSIPFLLMGLVLCIINYSFSLSYSKYWNVPDDLLRKLVKIECLGVIIAVLQLIIAFPQLRLAYESATSSDISELKKVIDNFNKHVESYQFANIPDSLQNKEVCRAKEYQQKLYAYSLYIVHADWNSNININEFNAQSDTIVLNVLSSHNVEKKDIKPTVVFMNHILRRRHYEHIFTKFRIQFNALRNFIKLTEDIHSYYSSTSDSIILSAQINWDKANDIESSMNIINKDLEEIYECCIESNKIVEKSKNFEFSKDAEIRYAETEKLKEKITHLFENESYKNTISGMDDMCLDFINFLNLIQFKYAYNIDY